MSHKNPSKDYSQIVCFICQKLGDMLHNCPRVQDREVVKRSESVKKADVEKATVVTEFAGQASAVAEYEVNSTSSNIFHWNAMSHMTPHKNWIRNYRCYKGPVKLADHRIIYSEGVGSILFRPVKNGKQYRNVVCLACREFSLLLLKYRKVTRPGIEPRTFWTYTRCSNQLSYPALEINQLMLYLCNC